MMIPGPITSTRILQRDDGLELWHIGLDRLADFSQCVYDVFCKSFDSSDLDLEKIQSDDLILYEHSAFLAITASDGDIISTGRVTRKNDSLALPIEKIFRINCNDILARHNLHNCVVWHGGRLSVNKAAINKLGFERSKSVEIFMDLNTYCFNLIDSFGCNAVMFGEADRLAKRIFASIGLPWRVVGDPIYYMGSETYPVFMHLAELDFAKVF